MKDPLEDAGVEVSSRVANRILVAFLVGLVAFAIFVPGSRTPLILITGIILMVMLHEAGHYYAAKRAGMKVTEYFLGFGPRLWSFRKGETEYGVKALPAGGYVRIIGMSNLEEVDSADEPRTFRRGTTKNRLIVILAGVSVNLLIAFVLFAIVLVGNGKPLPSTTIDSVVVGTAAYDAGLNKGDKIVAIDGQAIKSWDDLKASIEKNPGAALTLTVERNGTDQDITATPRVKGGQGFLGVSPTTEYQPVGLLAAIPQSFGEMGTVARSSAEGLGKIFSPSGVSTYSKNFTSAAPKAGSTADIERPRSLIGIVDEGSQVFNGNLYGILYLLGAISLVLALFNLLPLLPFDGGHAVIVVYEAVASRIKHRVVRVDFRKLMPLTAVVLAVFLTLGLSAMYLDIRQLGQ